MFPQLKEAMVHVNFVWTVLPYLLHSLDLLPSDLHLFRPIKDAFCWLHFPDNCRHKFLRTQQASSCPLLAKINSCGWLCGKMVSYSWKVALCNAIIVLSVSVVVSVKIQGITFGEFFVIASFQGSCFYSLNFYAFC